MTRPIDPAERARIAEDAQIMLTRLNAAVSRAEGDGRATELLWLQKNIGSVVRRHQETFPRKEVTGE